ncbi:hypothetical protein CYY_007673 [Polysphondylium violaceum]|uniref:Purple acid phosphatase n=1 Tax=Polysphondylium violaceum TaxID=133409 RepID=A0A8J4PP02_9MYCE|nr:hypothetical protein CYY_007673 [Polysphondylium violaceum]
MNLISRTTFLFFILFLVGFSLGIQDVNTEKQPKTIKLTLTDKPDQMVISWYTISSVGSPLVQYSLSKNGLKASHSLSKVRGGTSQVFTVNGTSQQYDSSSDWIGTVHSVTLQGLQPMTTYFYQCGGSESQVYSQILQFKTSNFNTSPNTVTPFVAAVYGDMGYGGGFNNTVAALISNLAKYSVVFHVGDISYADYDKVEQGNQTVWNDFLQVLEPITSRVPYMTTPGNHDVFYDFTAYQQTFNMPGSSSKPWYSFTYNGVHFISFSTESDLAPFTQQYQWIKNDLEAYRKQNPDGWVIAYAHRPYYCSTQYDWCRKQTLRALIESTIGELFQNYNVDLFMAGHTHAYERTVPVYQQLPIGNYEYPGGTIHFTIGTPGNQEGLDTNWVIPAPSWSAHRNAVLGYAELNVVNGTHILWKMISSIEQTVMDEQWMVKGYFD